MPRYKFKWENLPKPLLRGLKSDLRLEGEPADAMRAIYGARPSNDFVRDAWPTLLDKWLGHDRSARAAIVSELRDRRLGDVSVSVKNAAGQMDYLRTCKNSSTLRALTTELLIAAGEISPVPATQSDDGASSPQRSKAWPPFATSLAASLSALHEDQFLIVERKRSPLFVQFAAQGSFGMRAEMVSNSYLEPKHRLSTDAIDTAKALGWAPPTGAPSESTADRDPDGSPNYFREWHAPVPFIDVALMVVDTLVDVFGVAHPGDLTYHAFSADGADVLLPTLGLRVVPPTPADPPKGQDAPTSLPPVTSEEIAHRLLDVIRQVSGENDIEFDQDGDIPLRYGSTMVFVRVFGDPSVVRVFSLVLQDVVPSAGLAYALSDLNDRTVFMKWWSVGNSVLAGVDLFGSPLVEQHVLHACGVVGETVDGTDEQLRADFGGRTFFGDLVRSKPPAGAHGYL